MSKLDQELASKLTKMNKGKKDPDIGNKREDLANLKKIAWETRRVVEVGHNTPSGRVVSYETTSDVHEWLNQEFKKLARAQARQAKKKAKL